MIRRFWYRHPRYFWVYVMPRIVCFFVGHKPHSDYNAPYIMCDRCSRLLGPEPNYIDEPDYEEF